jgi:hypothetical protein
MSTSLKMIFRPARLAAGLTSSCVIACVVPAPAWAQSAENRLSASATVEGGYESNAIHASDQRFPGEKDNYRLTPRVDVSANQPLGRIHVSASVSAGYDFNSRFKFLNSFRVGSNGSASVPVGGTCHFDPSVNYFRFQTDLSDLQQNERNINQLFGFGAEISCKRAAGFSPYLQVRQDDGTNSRFEQKVSNYRSRSVTAGIDYNRPTLGTIRLYGSYRKIDRPELKELFGIVDGAQVESAGIMLIRNIAPRLGGTLSANYTRVDPVQNTTAGYSGIGYSGELTYRPSPRVSITAHAERSVTSETSISATYSLSDILRVSGEVRVSTRSIITGSASYIHRSFRGENIVPGFIPRGADSTEAFNIGYGYDLGKRMRLSVAGFYRKRDSDNSFYDYDSAGATVGATIRF